jgi:hypothetical protein
MAIYYLQFLWGLIAIPVLAYTVGTLTLKGLRFLTKTQGSRPDHLPELFFRLLLGTMVSIVLYALWKRGLNTIMSGFILTAILSCISYTIFDRNRVREIIPGLSLTKRVKGILLFLYVGISFFYFFNVLGDTDTSPFRNIFPDHGYYAQIGRNLADGYPENYFPTYSRLEQEEYGNTMYHYTEAWSSAVLSDLIGFPPVVALEVFHRSWFLFLVLLGVISMLGNAKKLSAGLLLLATGLLLAYTPFIIHTLIPEKYHSGINVVSSFMRPSYLAKIVYLGPIFICLLLLFRGGYRMVSIALSSGMIFLSGGLFIWPIPFSILSIIRTRGRGSKVIILVLSLLLIAIYITFYYFFYRYTGMQSQDSVKHYSTDLFEIYSNILLEIRPYYIIKFLREFFVSIVQIVIVIFPVLVISVIYISGRIRESFRKKIKLSDAFIILALLVLLSALVSLLLGNFIKGDAAQILGLTYSLIYLYVVIKVLKITSNASGRFLMFCVTLLAVFELYYSALIHRQSIIYVGTKILNTSLSHSFMEEIAAQDKHSDVGAFIQDTSGQRVANSAYARNYKNFFIHELQVQNNYCGFVSIYDDDVPWDPKDPLQDFVKESLFYLNYKKRPENAGLSKEEVRLKFLREYKIDWIVTDPNMELPPYLEKYRRKEICDGNTGFCIHYLDLTELLNES